MRRLALAAILATAVLMADGACFGAGLDSGGNTDGVLTWRLGKVEAGRSVREVVLFAFDSSHAKVAKRVQQARREFANLPDPPPVPAGAKPQPTAWIKNDSTDFALEGPGHFFWEGKRQSLTSKRGGQCSRFGWYVHYTADGAAARRAGTPITGNRTPEALRLNFSEKFLEKVLDTTAPRAVSVCCTLRSSLDVLHRVRCPACRASEAPKGPERLLVLLCQLGLFEPYRDAKPSFLSQYRGP